jgi:hypothetical protein
MFRVFAQAAVLDSPLSRNAAADAAQVLSALRHGHTFSVVTAFAAPASITLSAADGHTTAAMGDRLPGAVGPVVIRATTTGAHGTRIMLWNHGREVASGLDNVTFQASAEPGAYRAEAYLPDHPGAPWLVSNPVYVGAELPGVEPRPSPIITTYPIRGADADRWSIEHGPSSAGSLTATGTSVGFTYHVGTVEPAREYAALAYRMTDTSLAFDRLQFIAQADRPTRVSVQLRFPGSGDQRWIRSIYVDATPRPVVIRLEDLTPVGSSGTLRPVVAHIQTVLFVVDRTNADPGTSGVITLRDVLLASGVLGGAASGSDRQQKH